MWSDWLVFCDVVFNLSALWWEGQEAYGRFLMGKTNWGRNWVWVGPCSVSLQSNFLLKGGAVFPPCYLTWGQTMVEVMKVMVTSFKMSHACTATLSAPGPAAGLCMPAADPRLCWRLLDTYWQVWVSFLWSHCSFLLGPDVHKVVCALQESVSPVLSKFCKLYGGVNGDLLQEGLCHIQLCCTQSPCPCGSRLLTRTSTGDTQTQFCLSLCGVSGSWCAQGLFEPSKCLWWVWDLILNTISPLLPSYWGVSFALGCGVSFFWWDPTFSFWWLFSSEL